MGTSGNGPQYTKVMNEIGTNEGPGESSTPRAQMRVMRDEIMATQRRTIVVVVVHHEQNHQHEYTDISMMDANTARQFGHKGSIVGGFQVETKPENTGNGFQNKRETGDPGKIVWGET